MGAAERELVALQNRPLTQPGPASAEPKSKKEKRSAPRNEPRRAVDIGSMSRSALHPLAALLSLHVAACQPELPEADPRGSAAPPALAPLILEAAPSIGPSGTIPPRAQLALSGPDLDPGTVLLVRGEVSDVALAGLAKGDPPASTRARAVELRARPFGDRLLLEPLAPLAAGRHTLAVGSRRQRFSLTVDPAFAPGLTRVFPPPLERTSASVLVLCGDAPLPEELTTAAIEPTDGLDVRRGDELSQPSCAILRRLDGPVVPPPALLGGPSRIYLVEGGEIDAAGAPRAMGTASCAGGEVPLGPACVTVFDDHLSVRPPSGPVYVELAANGAREAHVTSGAPVTLGGLSPDVDLTLHARFLDERGDWTSAEAYLHTMAPSPRLVLNEVLADCLGKEPLCEWIELANVGTAASVVEGHAILDEGGATPLPDLTLAPGELVLVVAEGFAPGALDVPFAPGTRVVSVPKLGKNGLSNAGEELRLVDVAGTVISTVPAMASKPGRSLSRTKDGAYALAQPTPGAPNP